MKKIDNIIYTYIILIVIYRFRLDYYFLGVLDGVNEYSICN